jgi:hypothetical protein
MTDRKVPTEIYSRVVGYFRPVKNWNEGKKEEFRERHEFSSESILNNLKEESYVVSRQQEGETKQKNI